jgi:hypothetical protein
VLVRVLSITPHEQPAAHPGSTFFGEFQARPGTECRGRAQPLSQWLDSFASPLVPHRIGLWNHQRVATLARFEPSPQLMRSTVEGIGNDPACGNSRVEGPREHLLR